MGKEDEHGILPVEFGNKIHVRVDCHGCREWESIADYERNIHVRNFTQKFRECPKCLSTYCQSCLEDDKCPECAGETIEATPEEIFVCSYCIQEWGLEGGLCGEHCKYHKNE